MADDDEEDLDDEEDDDDEDEDGEPSSSGGSKKKLFLIIGVVLVLLIGGVAGAYFTGLLDPVMEMMASDDEAEPEQAEEGSEQEETEEPDEGDGDSAEDEGDEADPSAETVFYDLPEMLVNLRPSGGKSSFIKIRISLELGSPADIPQVEKTMPRILNNFQVYLREMRSDDLKGSAGMYRLRQELLTRVTIATTPANISNVLFKEILVQ